MIRDALGVEAIANPGRGSGGHCDTARIARRDEVVSALFVAHGRSLVSLARLMTDDQGSAEDLVQEAFLALHRNWLRMRAPESALPYLQRCVVNGSRMVLRHRRTLRSVHLPGSPDEAPADGPALDHDEQSRVRRLIVALPRRQRQVLVLRYYLDQNERQIAEVLGISAGSVKRHASRAIATLTAGLQEDPR